MAKILVTGAGGMLGQDLCPILENEGHNVIRTDISDLDITNFDNVKSVLGLEKPDFVIHCAAYTNVDRAEEDYSTAHLVNVAGTENLARVCANIGAVLVYISTDYVFDGWGTKPYKPDDKTSPVNKYGLSKRDGELAVRKYCEKFYICRTSWLYGIHGKNFVETMLKLAGVEPVSACESEPSRAKHNDTAVATEAKEKGAQQSLIAQAENALAGVEPELKVVDDQVGCPTWTVELSNAIVKIINEKPYGIYHTCGSGVVSWYGFAKKVFELAGLKVNLKPCTTEEYPRPAKRPKYSVMDNEGICRDWQDALAEYINLYHNCRI